MNTEKLELLTEIWGKQDKTMLEEMLLQHHNALVYIEEVLIDVSKCHINSDKAINDIRKYLNKHF